MDKIFNLKDGRKLGYKEYGNPQGKPLFFFHGWPSSRLQAHVIHEAAKKINAKVISLDRPGYGVSDYAPNRKLLDWPDDIIEFANKFKLNKFAVIGVSGGGPYAAACAYKIPRRLTKAGIVVGLAPTNIAGVLQGMAFLNKLAWHYYHKFPLLIQASSLVSFLQARKYLPDYFNFAYRAPADQELLTSLSVVKDIERNRKEAFKQGKKAAAQDLKLYTSDWGFRLKDIKAKVFLWYGSQDKNVSLNMGKYYAIQIPHSKLTIYPNEGHFIIKTHAEEIVRTLTK